MEKGPKAFTNKLVGTQIQVQYHTPSILSRPLCPGVGRWVQANSWVLDGLGLQFSYFKTPTPGCVFYGEYKVKDESY